MEPTTPAPADFAPPPFSPPPSPPPSISTHSVGKKIFFILIIVILLALIGAGVFAYTVVFEAPRTALTESFATITNARSLHQDVAIKVVASSSPAFTAEGTIATDIEQPVSGGRRTATIISGKSAGFFLSAEARFLDQTLYGKVIEFPLLSLLDFSTSTNPLGKWYSVSLGEVESFMTEYGTKYGVELTDIAKVKDQINKIGQTEGTPQFDTLIEKGVLVFGSRATLAQAGGDWARQYTVTIDKAKLASWVAEQESTLSLPMTVPVDPQALTESLKSITFDPIVVTIGLFDHSLKKITGGFKISGGAVSFVVTYRDIDGAITVVKPNNAIPIMQYINQSLQTAKDKAKVEHIKVEFSSLRAIFEINTDRNGSYANLCTKDSVASVLKSIEEKSGQKPTCRANSKAFLAAGEIASSTFWCVDSTGFSGGVDKIPSGFVCK
ncbi:MAG: hypothetical protein V1704_02745 [Candidatus Vogelbacteria bacterium]